MTKRNRDGLSLEEDKRDLFDEDESDFVFTWNSTPLSEDRRATFYPTVQIRTISKPVSNTTRSNSDANLQEDKRNW